jgi:DNA-binding transcriptional ArsR family regulator
MRSAKRRVTAAMPRDGAPLDANQHFDNTGNMKEQAAVEALAALAQTVRLRVFRALVGAAPDGMTPGALSAMLGLPASTLSFHLKGLIHAGLVTIERDGRNLIYRPALAQMNALLAYLTDHCCQGQDCAATPRARQRTRC